MTNGLCTINTPSLNFSGFLILLVTGIFFYDSESFTISAQTGFSPDNTNSSINQFNVVNASATVAGISPRIQELKSTLNISEEVDERASAVEARLKFLEFELNEERIDEPAEEQFVEEQRTNEQANGANQTSRYNATTETTQGLNSSIEQSNASLMAIETLRITSPNQLRIYHDSDLGGTLPPDVLFFRNEPAVTKSDNLVFYVGTYYASRSNDSGNTWNYIDLFSQMPNTCCDMDLAFDGRNQVFLWSMMNLPYNGSSPELGEVNNITLGVSDDTASWRFYQISADALNPQWTNNVLDYPQLFLTENYVYISVERFSEWFGGRANLEGPVMMRIERDALASGASGIPIEYMHSSPPTEVFTAVQGSEDTLYWATHITETTASTIRIYSWDDNSSTIRWVDRTVPSWNESNDFNCITPDGFNWCRNSDSRITGGWKTDDVIVFYMECSGRWTISICIC